MTLFLLVAGMVVLLFAGLPVAFGLGATGAVGFFTLLGGIDSFAQIPLIAYKSLDDFVLASIPLYILVSHILLTGKVGSDLFELANKWVRHLPGGMGVATILACAIFAAISGSSVATAVTIGTVAIPEMLARNYPRPLVLGLVAGGGTLGILIPPSIPMILYGAITGESVGALFIAGIIPGILLTSMFILYVILFAAKNLPRQEPASWTERIDGLKKSSWGLFLPILIIGGIYSGAFTPTEAAAVGVVYSLFITFVIYRTLTWRDMSGILLDTVRTNAMILAIIIGAMLFGFVLTILRLPQELTQYVTSFELNRWVVFLAINLLLGFLGCILETVSIILITVPILYPMIVGLGFDPIWFAIVIVVNMELALITPPVGMNLFVIQGIVPDTRMSEIIKGVLPFGLMMILLIALLAFFPGIATWLPQLLK